MHYRVLSPKLIQALPVPLKQSWWCLMELICQDLLIFKSDIYENKPNSEALSEAIGFLFSDEHWLTEFTKVNQFQSGTFESACESYLWQTHGLGLAPVFGERNGDLFERDALIYAVNFARHFQIPVTHSLPEHLLIDFQNQSNNGENLLIPRLDLFTLTLAHGNREWSRLLSSKNILVNTMDSHQIELANEFGLTIKLHPLITERY